MVNVKVKAVTECMDNGVRHQPGEVFEMEHSLVEPHVKAGQIEIVSDKAKPDGKKK